MANHHDTLTLYRGSSYLHNTTHKVSEPLASSVSLHPRPWHIYTTEAVEIGNTLETDCIDNQRKREYVRANDLTVSLSLSHMTPSLERRYIRVEVPYFCSMLYN